MSFTIQKQVPVTKTYPTLQNAVKQGGEELLDVTYSISSIISLKDEAGIAEYTVSIGSPGEAGTGIIDFVYLGGDPFTAAEEALKAAVN